MLRGAGRWKSGRQLDWMGVIQMTRERAEGWRREGEETGGDGSLRPPSLPCSQGQWDVFPICLLMMRAPCGDRPPPPPPLGNFLRVWRRRSLSPPRPLTLIHPKFRKRGGGGDGPLHRAIMIARSFSHYGAACINKSIKRNNTKRIKVLRCVTATPFVSAHYLCFPKQKHQGWLKTLLKWRLENLFYRLPELSG